MYAAAAETRAPCVVARWEIKIDGSCVTGNRGLILGGRSTVGHVALDHVIGVRIPASQPTSLAPLVRCLVGTSSGTPRRASLVASGHESLPPSHLLAAAINSTVVAGENPTVDSTVWLPAESVAPGR